MRGVAAVVLAAVLLAFCGLLVRNSHAEAAPAAFYRCAFALVVLAPVALVEMRRHGRAGRGPIGFALGAGVFLGLDYVMWAQSVLDTGVAVSTVLISIQVVVFPLLVWVTGFLAPPRAYVWCLPLMLLGMVLAGGILGADAGAANPVRGGILGAAAGVCYGVYLYGIWRCTSAQPRLLVTPLAISTAAATLTVLVLGSVLTSPLEVLAPDLTAVGWLDLVLLALVGQVAAWWLLNLAARSVPPAVSASIMLLQPLVALLIAAALAGERPTPSQLLGLALVVLAVWIVNGGYTVFTRGVTGPGRRDRRGL